MELCVPTCALCGERPLFFCPADQAFLCKDCDERVHSANFIVLRHVRSTVCQNCLCDTGMRVQGAQHMLQCLGSPCPCSVVVPSSASAYSCLAKSTVQLCFACLTCSRPNIAFPKRKRADALAQCQLGMVPVEARVSSCAEALCTQSDNLCIVQFSSLEAGARPGKRVKVGGSTSKVGEDDLLASKEPTVRGEVFCPPLECVKEGDAVPQWLRLSLGSGSQQERDASVQTSPQADAFGREGKCTTLGLLSCLNTRTTGSPAEEGSPYSSSVGESTECRKPGNVHGAGKEDGGEWKKLGEDAEVLGLPLFEAHSQQCILTPRRTFLRGKKRSVSSVGSCGSSLPDRPGVVVVPKVCKGIGVVRDERVRERACVEDPVAALSGRLEGWNGEGRHKVKLSEGIAAGFDGGPPPAAASALASVPLGSPAATRLRRVLHSWSEHLGGLNASTETLAFDLFHRCFMKMRRGEVAANFLRVTLAACLWLSVKLVELRAQVPGAKEVSAVTGVATKDLSVAELDVLKLLDWQPLKHVSGKQSS